MLSIIFVKIIASIVNFTETEGWEERGIGTEGGERQSERRRGEGLGQEMLHLPEVMVVLGTNGVHSWCGLALPVVNKPNCFISLLRDKR